MYFVELPREKVACTSNTSLSYMHDHKQDSRTGMKGVVATSTASDDASAEIPRPIDSPSLAVMQYACKPSGKRRRIQCLGERPLDESLVEESSFFRPPFLSFTSIYETIFEVHFSGYRIIQCLLAEESAAAALLSKYISSHEDSPSKIYDGLSWPPQRLMAYCVKVVRNVIGRGVVMEGAELTEVNANRTRRIPSTMVGGHVDEIDVVALTVERLWYLVQLAIVVLPKLRFQGDREIQRSVLILLTFAIDMHGNMDDPFSTYFLAWGQYIHAELEGRVSAVHEPINGRCSYLVKDEEEYRMMRERAAGVIAERSAFATSLNWCLRQPVVTEWLILFGNRLVILCSHLSHADCGLAHDEAIHLVRCAKEMSLACSLCWLSASVESPCNIAISVLWASIVLTVLQRGKGLDKAMPSSMKPVETSLSSASARLTKVYVLLGRTMGMPKCYSGTQVDEGFFADQCDYERYCSILHLLQIVCLVSEEEIRVTSLRIWKSECRWEGPVAHLRQLQPRLTVNCINQLLRSCFGKEERDQIISEIHKDGEQWASVSGAKIEGECELVTQETTANGDDDAFSDSSSVTECLTFPLCYD